MRGRRVDVPDPAGAVAAYLAGVTVPAIAAARGVPPFAVYKLLARAVPDPDYRRLKLRNLRAARRAESAAGRAPWNKGVGTGRERVPDAAVPAAPPREQAPAAARVRVYGGQCVGLPAGRRSCEERYAARKAVP